MKKRKISDAVVRRLPRYYRYLDDLHSKGIVRISSSLLGERMGITASQIRQDLSCFGEFGQQGYGYNILELRTEIGHILGVDEQHRLVVVGAGHLGHALLRNFDFMQTGFLLDTAFDVSPALIGTRVNNVLIRSFDEIGDYFAVCHPDVAVLTVPKNIAQEVADVTLAAGGLDAIVRLHALSRSLMGRLDRSFTAVMGINSALLAAGIVGIIRPQTSALLHNGTTIALAAESARRL